MRQYLKDKPIQHGFKHWCHYDSTTGYLFQFGIYTGSRSNTKAGLTEEVVLQLSESLHGKNIQVYMDNFYTLPHLLQILQAKNIYPCGSVCLNRKGPPKYLKLD